MLIYLFQPNQLQLNNYHKILIIADTRIPTISLYLIYGVH